MAFLQILLLAVVAVTAGTTDRCPTSSGVSFHLTVGSRRNTTGHWIVSVKAHNEENKLNTQLSPRDLIVDVDHYSVFCDTYEAVTLSAETAVFSGRKKVAPSDYEEVKGVGYYKPHRNALNWKDARDKCVAEGAHLMIINSQEEAQVFRRYFANKGTVANQTDNNYAHLGFHDLDTPGNFVTVLGEPLSNTGYLNWGPNEPSGRKNCGGAQEQAELYDLFCDARLFFVCEVGS